MTNLEELIAFLDLKGSEKDIAIINNFDNQHDKSFLINGDEYKLFTEDDITDIVVDEAYNEFDEMTEYLSDTKYCHMVNFLNHSDYYSSRVRNFRIRQDELPGYEYIGGSKTIIYI